MRPVDLCLFTGKRPQPEIRFSGRTRTVTGHDRTKMIRSARVTTLPDHLVQPAGSQLGVFLQGRDDERDVGVGDGRSQRLATRRDLRLG
jgi:hypothetical protein